MKNHNSKLIIISNSAKKTHEIGKRLASYLGPGDIIALYGELGAGKTILTKGIAAGLGVKEDITSPTFVIIREYKGTLPLFHFDVYRINAEQLQDLGYEDYFFSDGVTVIEWAERIQDLLPTDYLAVTISHNEKKFERMIEFKGFGKWQKRILRLF